MAGITQPNNYYKTRKALEKKGLLKTDQEGNIYIDTKQIVAQAKKQEEERQKEKEPSAGQGGECNEPSEA